MTYDLSVLEKDKSTTIPFIVRSNVEKQGYMSFVLPLLYNSTFSLVIDADDLLALPSSDWMDGALAAIQTHPSVVPVCGLYPNRWVEDACSCAPSI